MFSPKATSDEAGMREITYAEAIREALRDEMKRDPCVFLLGEDIGRHGGIFTVTQGLMAAFGPERVRDTPISELSIMAAAVGAALSGSRPVIEIMFGDFITLAMDQIVNEAAKASYMSGGQFKVPITIRNTMGAGRSGAAQHSQSLHAWFAHIPGLKVAVPATPYDAKGLLKTAIRDDNPVLFFEDKLSYNTKGLVPEEDYAIPFGQADVKRVGADCTVVAVSRMVPIALAAAQRLAEEGIDVEVVDPRTVSPLDRDTLVHSARKTHHVVVADEGYLSYGITGEIASLIYAGAFDYLDAPIERIGALDVPVPFSRPLELATIPSEAQIAAAVRRTMGRETAPKG
jgi:pyruvate dehydrogenase E1 component beta subunit